MNRWEMEQKIAIHAIKDPEFKKKLLKDPKKAIKEFFKTEKNLHLDHIQIKVEQEKKGEWIIALPMIEHAERLSEKELTEMAAGNYYLLQPGADTITFTEECWGHEKIWY